MKIGFDLDGTLDRSALRDLCLALLKAEHEVHVITGVFTEAGEWNQSLAKRHKLERLGIPYIWKGRSYTVGDEPAVTLHVLDAIPATFSRDERLADLGLRKGVLCEELGITIFFDDSSMYCKMIPKMSGNTLVCKVGMEVR